MRNVTIIDNSGGGSGGWSGGGGGGSGGGGLLALLVAGVGLLLGLVVVTAIVNAVVALIHAIVMLIFWVACGILTVGVTGTALMLTWKYRRGIARMLGVQLPQRQRVIRAEVEDVTPHPAITGQPVAGALEQVTDDALWREVARREWPQT